MVQLDSALMSGLLAERLVQRLAKQGAPHLDSVFLCNSGTESVEGALKFARCATGRPRILSLKNSYHGLSYGSLSVTGNPAFHEGFGPFLPGCETVTMGDVAELEHELKKGDVAAFIVELVQGKSVQVRQGRLLQPRPRPSAASTAPSSSATKSRPASAAPGKWFAFEHWGLEPDILTLAKALSGGYVPAAAIVTRRSIYQKTFSRMDRCIVHSTTFGRNNLACACGLAALTVIEDEGLVDNAAKMGALPRKGNSSPSRKNTTSSRKSASRGLMCAIEFAEPRGLMPRMGWKLVHSLDASMFPQLIVTPLLTKHRILTQVAANNADIVKILPPLVIG